MLSFLKRLNGNAETTVAEVDPGEAQRRQQTGALLVDVREPDEWASGHAAGAVHIPLGQLPKRLHELPTDREVLFICRSGRRSSSAANTAVAAGLGRVTNVRGGTIAWARAGLPVKAN